MQNYNELFGYAVKSVRKEKSLSQENLAELSGLSRAHVSRIERFLYNPKLDTLFKVSNGLGIKLSELVILMEGRDSSLK
ncbi:helix-turn-helix transcriptional regulator [Colwellia sp. BRX10-6]|jgi:transcriptional regulator with XRE-family HTH domain|uniref:helix-turn-helix domain-containing protein n=1 Tax=unclassified Colwellia TaxID=196834 RepID=UPI0015F512C3|nr:helix-turn-helix transcriptional regulator [Colwellia sp. BRX10-9]MBA6394372.1 helix-turn-helix transcriptional regulator [Colwellia sp. BRX10-6]